MTLLLMALVLVAGAAAFQWRMLSQEARQALPALIKRLAIMLVLGALVMGAWHAMFTVWISWQVFISHAATCGLLLHAVVCAGVTIFVPLNPCNWCLRPHLASMALATMRQGS